MIHYTPEQREFLKSYIPGHSYRQIAEEFSRRYTPITMKQAQAFCKNNRIATGRGGYFRKGQPSWNKGKHIEIKGRMREMMFKKGNIPWNHRPVGSERINVDGYIEIKTGEPHTWEMKHRLVYREHFGEIPPGYIVIFKDGNRLNLDPDNLAAISRAENARINKMGIGKLGKEVWETALLIAKLSIAGTRRREVKHGTDDIQDEE